ncbi:hypothetical protein M0805_004088 [Coniferiporia weirii]|nr:hypothetical protein M0805_004088 [Coniferiporia weirii]
MDYAHSELVQDTSDQIMISTPLPDEKAVSDELPDKISAYYSLAFPNFTYYIQTITVAIGRRSVRPGTPSSSDVPQVDVDLGPLKSVSRLHARIEYEESQERFVLVVLGRNGAWVDGIWSGSGSRVPLGVRSQIQVATRVFHFILPPPPAPEDSPSPSSPSSTTRHLSPSIDVTSLSPDSSVRSPSIKDVDLAPVSNVEKAAPEPVENGKPLPKSNGKKRKKPGADVRPPPPDVMPPRPQFTYAQLCYRAITSLNGKATLQEVCAWVSDNFEWYRYNEGTGWESSIRHNLSSNRAFKKMERCAGERGKGFFWSVDPRFEHLVKDQEGKGNGDGTKGKGRNPKLLEPPLKRSVKGDSSSPLPPPLNASFAFSASPLSLDSDTARLKPSPEQVQLIPQTAASVVASTVKVEQDTVSLGVPTIPSPLLRPGPGSIPPPQQQIVSSSATPTPNSHTVSNANIPTIPSDIVIPIVIGSVPSTGLSDASSKFPSTLDLSSPPIALHRDTIILNPTIFSSLTADQLKELEALGAKKAIEILQSYIVRFLKEKRKSESSKSKGKKKNKKKDGKDEGTSGAEAGTASEAGQQSSAMPDPTLTLPSISSTGPANEQSTSKALSPTSDMIRAVAPLRISSPPATPSGPSPNEEIDIMGDSDEPVSKRRKLDSVEMEVQV